MFHVPNCQRPWGRSHFREHFSFVHWNQMDLGKGSIGSLLPGTIDVLFIATPRSRRRMALVDDYNPLNSRMSPVRCYKNYQELRGFGGNRTSKKVFVKSSTNIEKNHPPGSQKMSQSAEECDLTYQVPFAFALGEGQEVSCFGLEV